MRSNYYSNLLGIIFLCFINYSLTAQSWQTLNANTLSWRFEDMQFIDTEVGWVVDGGGQILKTVNGGMSWEQQYYNSNHYFRSVEFFNESVGFAGTLSNGNPNATILKTTDGGQTWIDITSNLPLNIPGICGMHMINENTIFITGVFYGQAYIMKSTNQGDTWTYTNMGALCNALVDIYFKDENIGYAAGQSAQGTGLSGVILRTNDGGESWSQVAIGENSNERIWKIQELNDTVMYASVESFTETPQYFKSIDGGQSWQLYSVTSAGVSGTIQGIGFLNETIGWVGGFNNFFYETTNQGESWDYLPSTGSSFNRFQRINDTLMYTSGINVYKYVNPDVLSIEEFEIVKPKGHSIKMKGSNVIEGNGIIELELVNNTFCELSIYNTIGQRVSTIAQGMKSKGKYDIPISVDHLKSGHYYLVLYTYHGYESIKFIVD